MQKVKLAQALIHGPQVLVLDEPTNGLDPAAREETLTLIRDMIANSDSKIIVSSHLLNDIESSCHDVLVLKKGAMVAAGNIEEMRHCEKCIFEMKVKGDLDGVMSSLSERGCECRLNDRDVLEVTMPDELTPREVFQIASQLRAQVRHFYAKRDTLEDIFLKALEDEAAGAPAEMKN